jgi:drug/metabolite transporter (DMT)-like permease
LPAWIAGTKGLRSVAYGTDLGHAGGVGGSAAAAIATRERRLGWLCALSVLAIWVTFQLVGRFATRQALTPWDVTALRHVGAFLAVLPIVARRGIPRLPPWRAAAIVATSAFGFPIGAYLGFSLAPVELGAVILFGALPIVTALLGWALFAERPGRARLASLPVIAAGIAMIGFDTVDGVHPIALGGLSFFVATSCLALFTLLLRRWRIGALDAMLTLSLCGAPIYLPLWWLFLPSTLAAASWPAIAEQVVVQGVVTAVLAMFLFSRAVNALGAGPPTLVAALVPGMASLGAWWLLGERLDATGIAGVAVASAGMVMGVVRQRGLFS